ncbi:MAG: Holliday junction branch migration protein RuvA [Gemmatimonadota bacterium]|nr:Holliday junction branch migration protein RuvA [Gemmatimonadota bacterium]
MISRIRGTVLERDVDAVEILTASGLVYEVEVPLTVFQRLPGKGAEVELRTVYVVKEDSADLYGFIDPHERTMFSRLLTASGVGPKLALGMLSTYTSARLARALAERDSRALTQVSGVGKKKADKIILELADKVQDLAMTPDVPQAQASGAQEAVAALTGLGYSFVEADYAVREAVAAGDDTTAEALIRAVLASRQHKEALQ